MLGVTDTHRGQPAVDALIRLLDLRQLDEDRYEGMSPPSGPQRIFGGQVAGQALVATGLVSSASEARRAIAQGGVSMDGEKVTADDAVVAFTLPGAVTVLRRGKKTLAGVFAG